MLCIASHCLFQELFFFHECQLAPAFVLRVRAIENLRTASDDEQEVVATPAAGTASVQMTEIKITGPKTTTAPATATSPSPLTSPQSAKPKAGNSPAAFYVSLNSPPAVSGGVAASRLSVPGVVSDSPGGRSPASSTSTPGTRMLSPTTTDAAVSAAPGGRFASTQPAADPQPAAAPIAISIDAAQPSRQPIVVPAPVQAFAVDPTQAQLQPQPMSDQYYLPESSRRSATGLVQPQTQPVVVSSAPPSGLRYSLAAPMQAAPSASIEVQPVAAPDVAVVVSAPAPRMSSATAQQTAAMLPGAVPITMDISKLSFDDVAAWLAQLGLAQYADTFKKNQVDGRLLAEMTAPDFGVLGLNSFEQKKASIGVARLKEQGFAADSAPVAVSISMPAAVIMPTPTDPVAASLTAAPADDTAG